LELELRLLGKVNEKIKGDGQATLAFKYVACVTARQIATYLRYAKNSNRARKKTPYKLDTLSTIKIDEKAQRGMTDDGHLLQDEAKVMEIRDTLLGQSKEAARLFAGTLIWNIRPANDTSIKVKVERDLEHLDLPGELKLKIQTPAIWLTDSAHRHLGIAEAILEWERNKEKYPHFSDDYEFSVDLYNLDAVQESALFRELNAKQKKISASKAQETDIGSALGMLKSAILAKDQSNRELFDQNIEVSSNENNRHTLMTMSVFTATVQNMFGKSLIEESRSDATLREELAEFYCQFFYKLADEIEVKYDERGQGVTVKPFRNLYHDIIAPAVDKAVEDNDEKAEEKVAAAREKASTANSSLQTQEKIHSNAVVKALSRIAGYIRFMGTWETVISLIQSDLIAANAGRYFQASNTALTASDGSNPPIATIKNDGTLNIQVVDNVIREIERHLKSKLKLEFPVEVTLEIGETSVVSANERFGYTVVLSRTGSTYVDLIVDFFCGSSLQVDEDQLHLKLEVQGIQGPWKKAVDKSGKNRISPAELEQDATYTHPIYLDGVKRYSAKFEIDLPAFTDAAAQFDLLMEVEYPTLDGQLKKSKNIVALQPEEN
jgi:hypothetical protein